MKQLKAKFFWYAAICLFLNLNVLLLAADSLIFETNTLSDITQYLEDEVLVIFDIDNTIIEPVQGLGSDQWAWNRVKDLKAAGLSEKEAFKQTSEEWQRIHAITKVRTLESTTSMIIQHLQEQGYPIMALTTRRPGYASLTLRELNDVNIDFTRTAVTDHNLDFLLKEKALFTQGILFISLENKKGNALKEFLNKIGYSTKKIIFLDDKLSHVKDVEEACMSLGINYVGIRYGAADQHVTAFDPLVSEQQLFFLDNILSDDQAKLLKTYQEES